jgi:hypothetical protein
VEEWGKLSADERARVMKLRKEKKAQRISATTTQTTPKISSVTTTLPPVLPYWLIASFNSVSVSSVSAETACELDRHADTSVAGSNFILLEEPTRTVDVFGFSPELPPIKKFPIGTVGTAWVDPKSGQSYLLILNKCLFMGDTMKHSLLNPNQLHCNGLIVQDTSTMFDPTSTHSIYDPASGIRIPLDLNGVISYIPTYAPTLEEANLMKPIFVLTSNANWAAVSAVFPNQQRIFKVEAAKPNHPTQHMFMIEHANMA